MQWLMRSVQTDNNGHDSIIKYNFAGLYLKYLLQKLNSECCIKLV